MGDVTTLVCGCRENTWMTIVAERTAAPRPIQRPSDIERHPIDFGIEPSPAAPVRPEATIIKSAISKDADAIIEPPIAEPTPEVTTEVPTDKIESAPSEDDWGDGIL